MKKSIQFLPVLFAVLCLLVGCGQKDSDSTVCEHVAVTDEAVAPTCTSTGRTEGSHCGKCGEVLIPRETVPMTEHTLSEWTVTQEPTCAQQGIQKCTCSVCGYNKFTDIEMPEHTLSEWAVTQ